MKINQIYSYFPVTLEKWYLCHWQWSETNVEEEGGGGGGGGGKMGRVREKEFKIETNYRWSNDRSNRITYKTNVTNKTFVRKTSK